MQNINPELISRLVVSHFLSHLLKYQRESLGLSLKMAAKDAEWSTRIWQELEDEKIPLEPIHWRIAVGVLQLSPKDVVEALHVFIEQHPSVWFEKMANADYRVCERPVDGPVAMRSGNVMSVELNPLRPNLFYELCAFSPRPADIVDYANNLGYFSARETNLPPSPETAPLAYSSAETKRAILKSKLDELSEEKLGLLERVLDKFERFPPKTLAYAYQHFSLAVKR